MTVEISSHMADLFRASMTEINLLQESLTLRNALLRRTLNVLILEHGGDPDKFGNYQLNTKDGKSVLEIQEIPSATTAAAQG